MFDVLHLQISLSSMLTQPKFMWLGYGVAFDDQDGEVMTVGISSACVDFRVEFAEVVRIKKGLKLPIDKELSSLCVELDCLKVA